MFVLAKERFKRMIGIADFWDLVLLRQWKKSKALTLDNATEKHDKIISCIGKTIQDIQINDSYKSKGATLLFADGTKLYIDFDAELFEHGNNTFISTKVSWR